MSMLYFRLLSQWQSVKLSPENEHAKKKRAFKLASQKQKKCRRVGASVMPRPRAVAALIATYFLLSDSPENTPSAETLSFPLSLSVLGPSVSEVA